MTRKGNLTAVAIIAVLAAAVMSRQLITPAVFSCFEDDTICYINWTRQFVESFREGVYYPRWMADSHGGYGSPTFIFYQPLVTYLTAFIYMASGDMIFSVTLIKLIGLFLSGVFMYMFIKDNWGYKAGLVSAAVYMALPFRVFDIYLSGVHSSRFAFVWFPLILYFTRRAVLEDRVGKNTILLAFSYSLLCLTHLFSAYMFTPVLAGFGLLYAGRGRYVSTVFKLGAACLLGLMLAGFYLLPVLMERGLVHFEAMRDSWWSDYRNNFLLYAAPGHRTSPFHKYMGWSIASSALVGIPLYLYSRPRAEDKRNFEPLFFLGMTAVSLLMMTSISAPLWEAIPGMRLLSFPSRWASVAAFSISCIAGAGVYHAQSAGGGLKRLPGSGTGALLIAATLLALYCDIDIIRHNHAFTVNNIASFPKDLDLKEYIPKGASLDWLQGELKGPPAGKIVPLSGDSVDIRMERWNAVERSFMVEAASPTVLRIRTFYYPGWRASVDGRAAGLFAEEKSGAMLLNVPEGRHRVELTFSDTPDRVWGKILSALAAALVLYIFIRSPGKSCYN
jgi:hypothetical protein